MKPETKTLLFDLLRDKFEDVFWAAEYATRDAEGLIQSAIELNLIDAAKEMISDAKEYGYDYTILLK